MTPPTLLKTIMTHIPLNLTETGTGGGRPPEIKRLNLIPGGIRYFSAPTAGKSDPGFTTGLHIGMDSYTRDRFVENFLPVRSFGS